ncbi:MAG: glycosyltransferase [Salinibacterium sp.]|nr:MAG: glycosyltransferase [Salinibacterium sp.]
MKVAIVSSFVPFIYGGGRNIVEWLVPHLEAAGHQVDVIYLPFVETPDKIFPQLAAYRSIDLTDDADVVICIRVPAHVIQHPRKVLWFIHHLRFWYDLWDTPYRSFPETLPNLARREAIFAIDNKAFAEAHRIFTNSRIVGDRIRTFNGRESEVLYPPVFESERFHCAGANDSIVYLARLEHHKRQHLLVEALAKTKTGVRVTLAGTGSNREYATYLRALAAELGVADRVDIDDRWITEDEKVTLLANCLAVAYLPLDEDSYGYPALEASHASKAVLTTTDSGGVLELVVDGQNGFVTEPSPEALAEAMDRLHRDRAASEKLGVAAHERIGELGITWSNVVSRLLE